MAQRSRLADLIATQPSLPWVCEGARVPGELALCEFLDPPYESGNVRSCLRQARNESTHGRKLFGSRLSRRSTANGRCGSASAFESLVSPRSLSTSSSGS
jgi:hypothetical protein